MLSDTQKEELKKLTKECPIPKLKRILEDAVPKWISGEVEPKQGSFGVDYDLDIFVLDKKAVPIIGCCLLGTVLLEKEIIKTTDPSFNDLEDISCNYYYGLTFNQIAQIVNAFDDQFWISEEDIEFYNYVTEVRKVLFKC